MLELSGLDDLNVRRLQALLALNDLELDALAFLEGLVALLSDGREVTKTSSPSARSMKP